jgi:hypothetical protein
MLPPLLMKGCNTGAMQIGIKIAGTYIMGASSRMQTIPACDVQLGAM